MADITTSTAVGVAAFPFLAAIGVDPASIGAGLAGCIVVQTLLPPEQATSSLKSIAAMTIGSVLFASLATPFAAPIAISYVIEHYPKATISIEAVRAAAAAALGGFAQPILFLFRALLRARIARQQMKETPNA